MLYMLGGGWAITGPAPSPFSIAGLIEVAWDETTRQHNLEVDFVDSDGQPFLVSTPVGDQPLKFSLGFRVGRPPESIEGQSFTMPIAINVGPVPFQPGHRYVMRGSIGGVQMDEVAFSVRPLPQPPGQLQLPRQ